MQSDDSFVAALAQTRSQLAADGLARLKALASSATDVIAATMEDETAPQSLKLRAASGVLRQSVKLREVETLEKSVEFMLDVVMDGYFSYRHGERSSEEALEWIFARVKAALGLPPDPSPNHTKSEGDDDEQ